MSIKDPLFVFPLITFSISEGAGTSGRDQIHPLHPPSLTPIMITVAPFRYVILSIFSSTVRSICATMFQRQYVRHWV